MKNSICTIICLTAVLFVFAACAPTAAPKATITPDPVHLSVPTSTPAPLWSGECNLNDRTTYWQTTAKSGENPQTVLENLTGCTVFSFEDFGYLWYSSAAGTNIYFEDIGAFTFRDALWLPDMWVNDRVEFGAVSVISDIVRSNDTSNILTIKIDNRLDCYKWNCDKRLEVSGAYYDQPVIMYFDDEVNCWVTNWYGNIISSDELKNIMLIQYKTGDRVSSKMAIQVILEARNNQ